jgi:hypothetical protein
MRNGWPAQFPLSGRERFVSNSAANFPALNMSPAFFLLAKAAIQS